jgi:hypothetical protein
VKKSSSPDDYVGRLKFWDFNRQKHWQGNIGMPAAGRNGTKKSLPDDR